MKKHLLKLIKPYIRPIYIEFLFSKNRFKRKIQIIEIIRVDNKSSLNCPICDSHHCLKVSFLLNNIESIKIYCTECEHIFSTWVNKDLQKAQTLFDYKNKINHDHKSIVQEDCLLHLSLYSNKNNGIFLDFGVGGNIFIQNRLNDKYSNQNVYSCDINPRNEKNHFETYENDGFLHFFDGIASHAVLEHLDDTIYSWKYFNKLLKPMDKGGGIMVHAFPSQIHFDLDDWSMKIPEHVCLFSKKSLRLICEKTGFKLIKIRQSKGHHPMFLFKKIFDV